jgi:enoyl-CoA hydratase
VVCLTALGDGSLLDAHQDGGGVAWLTIGTGSRRNALGTAQWTELATRLERLAGARNLRVVALQGAGLDFCAGFDIRVWQTALMSDVDASFDAIERACSAVERLPVPAVAKIRGVALGAGCQLALACDIRIMGSSARIGMPTSRLGILPTDVFAGRLVAAVGPERAADLLYTGRLLDGDAANASGLVSRVVPDADLDAAAEALVAQIAEQPGEAIRASKRAVGGHYGFSSKRGAAPRDVGAHSVSWPDFQSSIRLFLERRLVEQSGAKDGDL